MDKTASQRKFLIKTPLEWYARAKLRSVMRIDSNQVCLEVASQPNARIKSSAIHMKDGCVKSEYSYATKRHFSGDYEDEYIVGRAFFDEKMLSFNKWKLPVVKSKYAVDINHRRFDIHVYGSHLEGLVIMTNSSHNPLDTNIIMPPYLEVRKEITNDIRYSEVELAALVPGSIGSLLVER